MFHSSSSTLDAGGDRGSIPLSLEPAGVGGGLVSGEATERKRAYRNLVLFSFGFVPLLAAFFVNLWARPQYQHFPLALIGAGFLIWMRMKQVRRPLLPGRAGVGSGLLVLTFACLAAATVLWSPWLGCIASLFGGAYLVWTTGGWKLLRPILPAISLAATVIPPPLRLDAEATLYLRSLAVTWSSEILDTLGVVHVLGGNIIELPEKKLLVEEACSGINSVLFILTACLFYTFWRRRGLLRVLLCVSASLAFVLMGNVIRITLGAWLEYNYHINLLSGWPHELMGLVMLAAYLGLIISFDELLQWIPLRQTQPSTPGGVAPARKTASPAYRRSPRLGGVVACLFGALGLAELWMGWRSYQHLGRHPFVMAANSALTDKAVFTMPDKLGAWSRVTAEVGGNHFIQALGISSKIWRYKSGPIEAALAFDYPFLGYHDVRICYANTGWNVAKTERIADPTGAAPARMEVLMRREPLGFGELWFTTLDEQGRPVESPEFKHNFLERWSVSGRPDAATYRVQVLVAGYAPLTAADRFSVTHFFEDASKLLTRQLVDQAARNP